MRLLGRCNFAWLVAGLGVAGGCAVAPRAVPVDPNVNFAAHSEHRGLVIDRMPDAQPAVLVTAGWVPFSGGPTFLLRRDDATVAAVWVEDAHATVRRGSESTAAAIGHVDASWQEGAILLTITPEGGGGFRTGTFQRVGGGSMSAALGQRADTTLDVRGVYRAELLDASGAPAGWLRVRVSPYQEAGRIYDGVLPAAVNGPLAAAAVARLDSEVEWVENHAADPYIGN
jgi:hypothetical protein